MTEELRTRTSRRRSTETPPRLGEARDELVVDDEASDAGAGDEWTFESPSTEEWSFEGGPAPRSRVRSSPWTRASAYVAVVAVALGALALYAPAVVGVPFFTKGEPREALAVAAIFDGGPQRWVVAVRNENDIPSKPPLFHWSAALASLAAGGLNETAIKAPSLAAGVVAIAVTGLYGVRAYGPLAGIAAAVILATSEQWMAAAVIARVDMMLAALLTIALASFGLGHGASRPHIPAAFFLFTALAVLTKGPVGWVLALAIVAIHVVRERDLGQLLRTRSGLAVLLLALPLVWYGLAYLVAGQPFLDEVFAENFYRAVDPDRARMGHARPFYYHVPLLLGGFAPWSLFLPLALADWWQHRSETASREARLPLVWAGVTFLLFSAASSKRAVYMLPAYPALALLVANWWARAMRGELDLGRAGEAYLRWACRLIAFVLGLVAALALLDVLGVPALAPIARLLDDTDAANFALASQILAAHRELVIVLALCVLGASLALAVAATLAARRVAFAAMAAAVVAMTVLVSTGFLRELAATQSLAGFMGEVRGLVPPRAEVSFYRGFDYGAAFYLGRPLEQVDDLEAVLESAGREAAGLADDLGTAESADAGTPKTSAGRARKRDDTRSAWILAWRPQADALVAEARGASHEANELARYTYGDNPGKDPLVLLRVTRTKTDADRS